MDDLNLYIERRSYGEHESQFVDIARPVGDPVGTIVSFHGGYWRAAYGLELHDAIVHHCVGLGWTVVNTEYRRISPDAAGVWEDMASDVLRAAAIGRELSGATPMVALGHSAGGHLALWVAAQAETKFDAVVALAPVTDLIDADARRLSDHVTLELLGVEVAVDPDRYRRASPLHLLPLGSAQLVVHGPNDEHVPYDMVADYVAAARSLGDEVTFANDTDIDHFNVIDPTHTVWRAVDDFLAAQRP